VNGVCYIDQGTGGQPWGSDHADDSQPYVQAYADQIYSFTRLDIQGGRLLGRCLRTSDGAILDGYQIDKPPVSLPWADAFPAGGPQLNWTAPWRFDTQCGVRSRAGNPSGDGAVFEVGDASGNQFAYPMLAAESMTGCAIEAWVYYDNTASAASRVGLGVRGRLLYSNEQRSYYTLALVRNDPIAADGHGVLLVRQAGAETVLADWPMPDAAGWHRLKLRARGDQLSAWIDGVLKTSPAITHAALPKGRPFVYNYRAAGGVKTLVDDVLVTSGDDPPTITREPEDQTVRIGATVALSVEAAGAAPDLGQRR
jgi:hypothetical protein